MIPSRRPWNFRLKLRRLLESKHCDSASGEKIEDAYYFNADPDPPTAKVNAFHSALSFPPPSGPGLRVKLYWLQKKELYWPACLGGGPVLHPTMGIQYEITQQKAVDVGLAFHLMRSFGHRKWRKLFLAAGDGDFYEAVQHLVENENVDLFLVGTISTISDELKPYARATVPLDEIASQIARPQIVDRRAPAITSGFR
jgi:uncharacterized LabA/DUF88 family protein